MKYGIENQTLSPERAFKISDTLEKMRQKLASSTYPSVAGHCQLLLDIGLEVESIDLQVRCSETIRDYINRIAAIVDKAKGRA
ncbi:MAG: hypothetical protein Kapaf2KO_23790 [Candidatus Kapaibacteriales bacterium]